MNGSWVLDAWAILALLQAEEPAARRIRALLESAQPGDGGIRLHMSLINLGEVFYRVGRTRNLATAESWFEVRSCPQAYRRCPTLATR